MFQTIKKWLSDIVADQKRRSPANFDADQMYLLSIYGDRDVVFDDKERLKVFIIKLNNLIMYKSQNGICHCSHEVPADLAHKMDLIIRYFQHKKIKVILMEKIDDEFKGEHILFLYWKRKKKLPKGL